MNIKNVFKSLAFAMLMPAMLFTTSCANEDEVVNNENNVKKGYTLPVTVNVTRQGDKTGTRTAYDSETKKLGFTAGDQLLVEGDTKDGDYVYAGILSYDAESGKFTGELHYDGDDEYEGTYDDLFKNSYVSVLLLPNGYKDYGFLKIDSENTWPTQADESPVFSKAIAADKATAIEQFSYEMCNGYNNGFQLEPANAIVNVTYYDKDAAEQEASPRLVDNSNGGKEYGGGKNVPFDENGYLRFAIGVDGELSDRPWSLDDDEGTFESIALGTKDLVAGHVYNWTNVPAPAPVATDLSTISVAYTASDGETLTGTLGANVQISIADGATVTLDGLSINADCTWTDGDYAGLTCIGDATIILTGENTVKGFYQTYPGIYVPENKTVTIQGIGSLTASSSNNSGVGGAGIGGGYQLACGNITIMGGSITAMGSIGAAGIGSGSGNNGSCGNITITGGNITATGGNNAAGIGSGNNGSFCDNITITGGNITATGGNNAAGIGSGNSTSCGNITITGGTINATGTSQAAGIGSGYASVNKTASCGTITITTGVTKVTATKGNKAPNSIGVGKAANNATNTCGTVTIGCTLDASGNPVGGTTGAITESPYTYQP